MPRRATVRRPAAESVPAFVVIVKFKVSPFARLSAREYRKSESRVTDALPPCVTAEYRADRQAHAGKHARSIGTRLPMRNLLDAARLINLPV